MESIEGAVKHLRFSSSLFLGDGGQFATGMTMSEVRKDLPLHVAILEHLGGCSVPEAFAGVALVINTLKHAPDVDKAKIDLGAFATKYTSECLADKTTEIGLKPAIWFPHGIRACLNAIG